MSDTKTGANMQSKPIRVCHAELQRYRDTESLFRKYCPVCHRGALMVSRDPVSLVLSSVDRCTWCGQTFVYSDAYIGGEPVSHVEEDPS
jgi:hypothetical protein